MIGVDVVDADGGVADARLAGARIADGDLLPAHDFGTTGGVDADGVGHGVLLRVAKGSRESGGESRETWRAGDREQQRAREVREREAAAGRVLAAHEQFA